MVKRVTICVGDIHGHLGRLQKLWGNLELKLGAEAFGDATVIFLGDYNDRGSDTKGVLDFLVSLPRRYPQQRHVFLCGNHDFAFAAFLGVLPAPPSADIDYPSTWDEFQPHEKREGWWSGPGQEDIHLQGRRWAGKITVEYNTTRGENYKGSIYDARPTFESYGVAHGDRAGLIAAVPDDHKEFLRNLAWVHEQEGEETGDPETSYSKLIAVHAGLESKSVDTQMQMLQTKDAQHPRIEPLAGRKNVWNTPPELAAQNVLVVSGHHGKLHFESNRLIIDESGGFDHRPIAAMILPARELVRDTDDLLESKLQEPQLQPILVAH
ncbi:hypothetical protein KC19_4G254200 [Ceratodon purpureus]|uniref:Calcineurin-like phosphoesterase domain-containing protein n=1 Tax=Ceratodon purpureus TaxID=3225 RepID=A0A8T0IF13_CERPU|nr:hypothetical protein KC19_4G254200 [Ceratodon purpureus]